MRGRKRNPDRGLTRREVIRMLAGVGLSLGLMGKTPASAEWRTKRRKGTITPYPPRSKEALLRILAAPYEAECVEESTRSLRKRYHTVARILRNWTLFSNHVRRGLTYYRTASLRRTQRAHPWAREPEGGILTRRVERYHQWWEQYSKENPYTYPFLSHLHVEINKNHYQYSAEIEALPETQKKAVAEQAWDIRLKKMQRLAKRLGKSQIKRERKGEIV